MISNIAVARNWKKLTHFNMAANSLKDVSPLKNLVHLYGIWIPDNNVKSIDELAKLKDLEILVLEKNPYFKY